MIGASRRCAGHRGVHAVIRVALAQQIALIVAHLAAIGRVDSVDVAGPRVCQAGVFGGTCRPGEPYRFFSKTVLVGSSRSFLGSLTLIMSLLEFRWWHVVQRREKSLVVEPVYPVQCREFDGLDTVPRAIAMNHFCLIESIDGLCQRVVITVTDASHGGLNASLGEPLSVADRQVLYASIAVMHQVLGGLALAKGLFECVECQIRLKRRGDSPADDAPREDVNHE